MGTLTDKIIRHMDGVTSDLREELDEHLDAINENTEEISIQNSALCELDNRMNKIEEKMDNLQFMFKQLLSRSLVSVELTQEEQKVFLVLYTHDGYLSSGDIESKCDLRRQVVEDALMSVMDKGVPVEREILDRKVFFRLNDDFRQRQAKEKIIRVDPEIKCQFQNALLKKFFE